MTDSGFHNHEKRMKRKTYACEWKRANNKHKLCKSFIFSRYTLPLHLNIKRQHSNNAGIFFGKKMVLVSVMWFSFWLWPLACSKRTVSSTSFVTRYKDAHKKILSTLFCEWKWNWNCNRKCNTHILYLWLCVCCLTLMLNAIQPISLIIWNIVNSVVDFQLLFATISYVRVYFMYNTFMYMFILLCIHKHWTMSTIIRLNAKLRTVMIFLNELILILPWECGKKLLQCFHP